MHSFVLVMLSQPYLMTELFCVRHASKESGTKTHQRLTPEQTNQRTLPGDLPVRRLIRLQVLPLPISHVPVAVDAKVPYFLTASSTT